MAAPPLSLARAWSLGAFGAHLPTALGVSRDMGHGRIRSALRPAPEADSAHFVVERSLVGPRLLQSGALGVGVRQLLNEAWESR